MSRNKKPADTDRPSAPATGGEFVISRSDLFERNACREGHATFAKRFEGIEGASFDRESETWTLAHGWTDDVTQKLAAEAPTSLRWYVRHGYAPADCGWREAIQAAQCLLAAGARHFLGPLGNLLQAPRVAP